MVAHPGVDVLILALTCTVTVRAAVRWSQRLTMGVRLTLVEGGCQRPSVPNTCPSLLAEVLSQHAQHDSGLATTGAHTSTAANRSGTGYRARGRWVVPERS